jgi:coenzyme F420 hydrogenase subunit beta
MLNKVLQSSMCAGCGLCQSAFGEEKIQVKIDNNGFYRPTVINPLNATENEQLKKFCPGIVVKKEKEQSPLYDSIWGEMHSCIIGASSDETTRSEASSGGAISSLLKYLLSEKLVDAVIHIGASEEVPYINEVKISTNEVQILQNANSRYAASAPLVNLHQFLKREDHKSFAFVGKPCDVAALRQYSKINPEVEQKIKYFLSFFCAGVPSTNATLDIVDAMAIEMDEVKKIDYRKEGWPGFFRVTDKNDRTYKLSYSFTWMKLLSPKVQFRCKVCPDGVGHLSDIVCADGWDSFDGKGFPTFKNAPGKSIIISRTAKGEELLQHAIDGNAILKLEEIRDFRKIDRMQPGQMSKKRYHLARKLAAMVKTGFVVSSNVEFYWSATFTQSLLVQIKNFFGTLKRIKKVHI